MGRTTLLNSKAHNKGGEGMMDTITSSRDDGDYGNASSRFANSPHFFN